MNSMPYWASLSEHLMPDKPCRIGLKRFATLDRADELFSWLGDPRRVIMAEIGGAHKFREPLWYLYPYFDCDYANNHRQAIVDLTCRVPHHNFVSALLCYHILQFLSEKGGKKLTAKQKRSMYTGVYCILPRTFMFDNDLPRDVVHELIKQSCKAVYITVKALYDPIFKDEAIDRMNRSTLSNTYHLGLEADVTPNWYERPWATFAAMRDTLLSSVLNGSAESVAWLALFASYLMYNNFDYYDELKDMKLSDVQASVAVWWNLTGRAEDND